MQLYYLSALYMAGSTTTTNSSVIHTTISRCPAKNWKRSLYWFTPEEPRPEDCILETARLWRHWSHCRKLCQGPGSTCLHFQNAGGVPCARPLFQTFQERNPVTSAEFLIHPDTSVRNSFLCIINCFYLAENHFSLLSLLSLLLPHFNGLHLIIR